MPDDSAPQAVDDAPGSEVAFTLVPERSAVLVSARSNVGPIQFGMSGLRGSVTTTVVDGRVVVGPGTTGVLHVDVGLLRSGNQIYDAELLRRIDARRYPTVAIELRSSAGKAGADRFELEGAVQFHGVSREVTGYVTATVTPAGSLLIEGEHVFDIRDFDVTSPSMLMLKIYPDVRVQLHAEAEPTRREV